MRAYRYHSIGSSPRLDDVAKPEPGTGEVLVRVHYASLNPVDWKLADGRFRWLVRGGRPRTMGSDFAGEVAALGAGVGGLGIGQRVHGFVDPFARPLGTFAEFVPVPARYVFPLPGDIEFRDAAALPCVGVSAVAICDLGEVGRRSRVLVNGASGGVGHMAVQVAKARGAWVAATASAARRDFVMALGADAFVDYSGTPADRWPAGFETVLDCVPNLPRHAHRRLLVRGGRYVSTLPGAATYTLDPLLNKIGRRKRYGLMLAPSASAYDELHRDVAGGRLRCAIEAEYPLEQVATAIERSRAGHVQGKLVVRVLGQT
jgi:NADPH:quinone reductase-like Zn-dependent oxidoreductase